MSNLTTFDILVLLYIIIGNFWLFIFGALLVLATVHIIRDILSHR